MALCILLVVLQKATNGGPVTFNYLTTHTLQEKIDLKEPVTFLGNAKLAIVAVAAGDNHAVLLTDTGSVFVWGSNDNM